jgi:hypothetical protein
MVRIVELRSQDPTPDAVFHVDLAPQSRPKVVTLIGLHGELVGLEDAVGAVADRVGVKMSFFGGG